MVNGFQTNFATTMSSKDKGEKSDKETKKKSSRDKDKEPGSPRSSKSRSSDREEKSEKKSSSRDKGEKESRSKSSSSKKREKKDLPTSNLRELVKARLLAMFDELPGEDDNMWKVLIVDKYTLSVISSACRVRDILQKNITSTFRVFFINN